MTLTSGAHTHTSWQSDLSQTVACNACGLVPQQVFTGSVIPYLKKRMGRGSRPELIKGAIG